MDNDAGFELKGIETIYGVLQINNYELSISCSRKTDICCIKKSDPTIQKLAPRMTLLTTPMLLANVPAIKLPMGIAPVEAIT